ncbi:hypothetical protein GLOIN_2v1790105 [Rhizophagus irregularis DAOM 181602=DAOM 197198]|nr:hypothetical protein GLOIN_2v1790105 [Rhizophagus irregularis DAOM 181602=DAOM 197198]
MIIIAKGVLLGYEVCVFDKILQEAHLPFPAKPMKRSLDEIKILTQYIFSLRICYGQNTNGFSDVVYIRGTQLINNAQTTNKEHVPFAFLEKQERLQEKIEKEEIQVSTKIANVVHTVSENIASKKCRYFKLASYFQELIHIQAKKLNGTDIIQCFLRWAISVYSKSGYAAYNAMKTIMRLPSISTLKSYNKWKMNNVRDGKTKLLIKCLLWSQRENCYVDYLDFEDEMQEYQEFCHTILAAKLECIGIHTIGSICDGAAFIRPQTPLKSEWNINEFCEFKNPKDNQWYLGKITNFDSITSIFTVEIPGSKNKPIEEWQVFNHHISEFLRPVHDIE